MHKPVVRTYPDNTLSQGRFFKGKNGAIILNAGVVMGERTSRRSLFTFVVTRQVSAYLRPAFPFVGRPEQNVCGVIQLCRIMLRNHYRRRPLEPVFQVGSAPPHGIVGPGMDIHRNPCFMVIPGYQTPIAAGIYNVRITRIGNYMTAFPASNRMPVCRPQCTGAWSFYCAVILLCAVYIVGVIVISVHMVKLRCRVFLVGPVSSTVKSDIASAVVSVNHPVGIIDVDPQSMIIPVGSSDPAESCTAVGRF